MRVAAGCATRLTVPGMSIRDLSIHPRCTVFTGRQPFPGVLTTRGGAPITAITGCPGTSPHR